MTRDLINSHKTAIGRKRPSVPARYLVEHQLVKGRALDYGSGRGTDARRYGWIAYDPYYSPYWFVDDSGKRIKYRFVICSYVLNTLLPHNRTKVISDIKSLLTNDGIAYLTVRRNVKTKGYTSRGTYQENVRLRLPIVRETSDYCIYRLTK